MLTKDNIPELLNMQKRFKELYWQGITSISNNDIHLDSDTFMNLFSESEVAYRINGESEYPHQYQCMVDGVIFFCISKTKIPKFRKE